MHCKQRYFIGIWFFFQTHKLQTCAVNGTRPVSNRTCKPRPLGFMMRLCNICQAITVTMRHWAKDGATWVWNGFVNATTTMTDKGYCGMMFVSSWTWERMIWLINETRETVTWIAERALERIQQIVIRLGLWAWDGLAWLAEMIWWGASRLAAGLWDVGAWLGNCIAEIYAGYLESKWKGSLCIILWLPWRQSRLRMPSNYLITQISFLQAMWLMWLRGSLV